MRFRIVIAIMILGSLNAACAGEFDDVVQQVIERDARNAGIEIGLRRIEAGSFEFDLREVSGDKSAMDVFRVLLHVAESQKESSYFTVTLAYQGDERFILSGSDFKTLGTEFGTQNPMFTLRTFPEKLLTTGGDQAFPKRAGGLLYLAQVQMKDFGEFNNQWFLNDLRAKYQAEVEKDMPTSYSDDDAL